MNSSLRTRASLAVGALGTPLLYAASAVVVGMTVPRLEARWLPDLTAGLGAASGIAVLSAIASGMLPLTGLVFSHQFVPRGVGPGGENRV